MQTNNFQKTKPLKHNGVRVKHKATLADTPDELLTKQNEHPSTTDSVVSKPVHVTEALPESVEAENDSIEVQALHTQAVPVDAESLKNNTEQFDEEEPHTSNVEQFNKEESLTNNTEPLDERAESNMHQAQEAATPPLEADLIMSNVQTEEEQAATPPPQPEAIEVDDLLFEDTELIRPSKRTVRNTTAELSIVNHNNGKRVKLSNNICEQLALTDKDTIDIAVKNKQVLLKKSSDNNGHVLKPKNLIYGATLVEAITEEFSFDFSEVSTHHLNTVEYKKSQNQIVVVISK